MSLIHKDIRIEFKLGEQPFEAVGFLDEEEESVTGEDALRHVNNGHIVRTEEDWKFVYEHRAELPVELAPYWLVTTRPYLNNSDYVSCIESRVSPQGHEFARCLSGQWHKRDLILRRLVQ